MTPYPPAPIEAKGPMRMVWTTYPSLEVAEREVERIVRTRLAACAHLVPIRAQYWWRGRIERAEECLAIFKTVPKRVGALFEAIAAGHPYEVPEIVEVDVPRVSPGYLDYLAREITRAAPPPMGNGELTRPAARRARAASRPAHRRAPRHPRSRGTRTTR